MPIAAANSISSSRINGTSTAQPDGATWKYSMNPARATQPTSTSTRRATPSAAAGPAPFDHTATRQLFLRMFPSICLPMFMASIDGTIVATALPNIAGSLGDVA